MVWSCCRSPPRPSPGGLHYSDEDICNKYNGAVLTESVNLQEKSVDGSESEVSAAGLPSRDRHTCFIACEFLNIDHLLWVSQSPRGVGRADGRL